MEKKVKDEKVETKGERQQPMTSVKASSGIDFLFSAGTV